MRVPPKRADAAQLEHRDSAGAAVTPHQGYAAKGKPTAAGVVKIRGGGRCAGNPARMGGVTATEGSTVAVQVIRASVAQGAAHRTKGARLHPLYSTSTASSVPTRHDAPMFRPPG